MEYSPGTDKLGETANLIKKIERGDLTLDEARPALAKELADVQTYLDLLAFRAGVDLGQATIAKFNEVSVRVGSPVRLDADDWRLVKPSAVGKTESLHGSILATLTVPPSTEMASLTAQLGATQVLQLLPGEPVNTVLDEIGGERRRQIEAEGWTPEHDDQHGDGQMARAAACYAMNAARPKADGGVPVAWPWADAWWKPKDARRDLVRAGALIVAELERLDRADTAAAREEWIGEVVAYVQGLSDSWTDDKARRYAEDLFHNTCNGHDSPWPEAVAAVEEDRQDWTE
ncbi:MazG-like family protein [Azospirillum argentinense]